MLWGACTPYSVLAHGPRSAYSFRQSRALRGYSNTVFWGIQNVEATVFGDRAAQASDARGRPL
jgi:hypothetical protein